MRRGLITSAALALALAVAASGTAAHAEEAPEATSATDGPAAGRVYTSADFVQFAPKTALDMLQQVPGFAIRETEQGRGLGQASGNVLLNSRRLTSKSEDVQAQLARIPASSVERIELVDAASLDVPGLTGLVANIVARTDDFSGQFYWSPRFRAHYAAPLWTKGEVSVTGKAGPVGYTLGLSNTNAGRGAAGGGSRIFDGNGALLENRVDVFRYEGEFPKLSGKFAIDGPGSSLGNLTLVYQRTYEKSRETSRREPVAGIDDRTRTFRDRSNTWNWEIGGDWEFALGPGRLKAIGLARRSHEPYDQSIVTVFDDGRASVGDLYRQTGEVSEQIVRAEYGWKMLGGDWQLAGEAAFNSLRNVAAVGTLQGDGTFLEQPFPGGTGGVKEDRYDASLSFARPLTGNLGFQLIAGAEKSTLRQTGPQGLTRSFVRPKGSLSLAWKPHKDFDLSVKLERRVGQLSFYDFLARQFLDEGNQNSGNNELKPQQDWTVEIEANKSFDRWGSVKLRFVGRNFDDYVQVIPLPGGGESVGNIAHASARAIEGNATIQLEALGWKGAKLDLHGVLQTSSVPDLLFPGRRLPFNGFTDRQLEVSFRDDLPGTKWALGFDASYNHRRESYRLSEVALSTEGPVFLDVFVEHKDVLGMTARAIVGNILNARNTYDRTAFTGPRGASPIAFVEKRNRLIGPIFKFELRGNF